MGVAPLPFDARKACFCTFGCPTFKRPQQRYWVVVNTAGEVPVLDTGILVQRDPSFPISLTCFWSPDPPLDPNLSADLIKVPVPPEVPNKASWEFVFEQAAPFIIYTARHRPIVTPCDGIFELPKLAGPAAWSDAKIFPVRWFEDADDVPH